MVMSASFAKFGICTILGVGFLRLLLFTSFLSLHEADLHSLVFFIEDSMRSSRLSRMELLQLAAPFLSPSPPLWPDYCPPAAFVVAVSCVFGYIGGKGHGGCGGFPRGVR